MSREGRKRGLSRERRARLKELRDCPRDAASLSPAEAEEVAWIECLLNEDTKRINKLRENGALINAYGHSILRQRLGKNARRAEPEDETTRALRAERPRVRGDCAEGPRPCPWASCRYHLYGDLFKNSTGGIDGAPSTYWRKNKHGLEVWDMPETCALDVADKNGDGVTQDAIAKLLGATHQRVSQVEARAMKKVRGKLNIIK